MSKTLSEKLKEYESKLVMMKKAQESIEKSLAEIKKGIENDHEQPKRKKRSGTGWGI